MIFCEPLSMRICTLKLKQNILENYVSFQYKPELGKQIYGRINERIWMSVVYVTATARKG
jgi:hypothetical protein